MKILKNFLVISTLVAMASCSSAPKKVPYVVDAEVIPQEILSDVKNVTDPVLSPGDLLNIEITASNMAAVVPFNKGYYVTENGTISKLNNTNMSSNADVSTDYYLISEDGNIDLPGLGIVKAAGYTKSQLASEIADMIYPKFIKERPKVEIRLMNFRVVVTGAVRSPGVYQSHNERMNFFEALAMAGDLDIKGERETIMLYRVNADGTREVHRLNIHDKNFLLSPYFNLQQNDIIYVTPNKSMAHSAWAINPGVQAALTYLGGISSLASLVIGIVNLTNK